MSARPIAFLAIALAAGALAACSKPAEQTADNVGAAAAEAATSAGDAAANAADGALAPGGAVSPLPGNAQNDAVNGDANTGERAQAAGSNSFTEGQAKGQIENAGYTGVGTLTKTPDGFWTGSAMKGGKTVQVSVDFKGAVSAK